MEAQYKLNLALGMVRPDLRENFLRDLVNRLAGCVGNPAISEADGPANVSACMEQALESVDVNREEWRSKLMKLTAERIIENAGTAYLIPDADGDARCSRALASMLAKGDGVGA